MELHILSWACRGRVDDTFRVLEIIRQWCVTIWMYTLITVLFLLT